MPSMMRQVALSRKIVNGELVLEKAEDHIQRVEAWRVEKQRLFMLADFTLRSRTDPSTDWIEERLRPITEAWYKALADPRAFADKDVAEFHRRLGPVYEKLRALAYHRGHLERYRREAHEGVRRLAPASIGGVGAIASSACLFEFQAFEAAGERRPECREAAKLLSAAEWVDDWEDDSEKPGSLRRAITHYGGLQIHPLQARRSDTRLVALGGLSQDQVDLLAFVDKEIGRITDLVISVSVALFRRVAMP